jgi:hypothetical protein
MKTRSIFVTVAGIAFATALSVNAQSTLTEVLFNEDGTFYDEYPNSSSAISAPGLSVTSGFGASTQPGFAPYYLSGLGTIKYTVTGAGAHSFIGFVDDEADYVNGVFDDHGFVSGASVPGGMSWQIDQPGPLGNLAAANGPLLDENNVPTGNNDVSFALGFNFNLTAGETATIDLSLTSSSPGGFYLGQANNLDNGADMVYYSGSLTISGQTNNGVPDTGETLIFMLMALTGLAVMMGFERKISKQRAV